MILPKIRIRSMLVTTAVFLLYASGYELTAAKLGTGGIQYLLLNIVAAAATAVTILKLKDYDTPPPAWLVLFVLLVFGYIKFYWLVLDPEFAQTFFTLKVKLFFLHPAGLANAFLIQTISFVVYCSVLIGFSVISGRVNSGSEPNAAKEELPCPAATRLFMSLALFLMPLLAWLVYKYKVGILGMPSKPMPLHLSGVIFYSQIIVLPGLILAQIYAAYRSGSLRLARVGGGLLLLWAISDAVLRTSRASLLLAPLLILFLALSGGLRLRKIEVGAVLGAGFMAVFFLPQITKYRMLRMSTVASFDSLAYLFYNFSIAPLDVLSSAAFLLFRVPGIETMVLVLGFPAPVIGAGFLNVLFSREGLSGYITHNLMGIPVSEPTGFASSFLGGAYLCGGSLAVIIASVLVALMATYGWNALKACRLEILPVARAFFLILLFWGITEGVSPILFKQAAAAAATVLVLELIMRGGSVRRFLPGGGRK